MADAAFRSVGARLRIGALAADSPARTLFENEFFPEPAPPPGATGGIKVWLAGAWVIKPVKVWLAGAWVIKPFKRWSGTAWETLP